MDVRASESIYTDDEVIYNAFTELLENKRWLINDTYNCYYEVEVWATGPITANDKALTGWITP